jgi:transcription initiation factor TFIID subunit TAF12
VQQQQPVQQQQQQQRQQQRQQEQQLQQEQKAAVGSPAASPASSGTKRQFGGHLEIGLTRKPAGHSLLLGESASSFALPPPPTARKCLSYLDRAARPSSRPLVR